ncbi:acyl-CoA synthetase (AMP-forming)/AMP-acid ligase II [Rubricella aquisinus]|uniref:Acyl-CoA synthetase (AMP-forming)/AMP-acid ligase II n=1 Tax=Rubricella aquisinus TaxID=2028108 RepID=A0A840WVB3_9RHOB|nr:AMP-binding protein [Rubricella aquisinus]MBB5514174.1 acyl-CoA synthetase (AMP-forming)/AMP-acid ligase II [Rubricella aquisinus]
MIHAMLDAQPAERVMLITGHDTRHSYGKVQAGSSGLSDLLALQGVRAGDRVLIVTENCARAIIAIFAAARLGAWAVPVNARLSDAELDRIIAHARPRAVLFALGGEGHATRHEAHAVDTGAGRYHLTLPHASNPSAEAGVAVMLYTTGTTGQPKGVMLTHDNLRFAAKASAELRGMGVGDVVYGALPITHVFGLASMIMAATHAGATIRLHHRFTPEALFGALQQDVTILPAVPQMHALLMQYVRAQGFARLEGSALRYVSSGAAPLDPEWKRAAEAFYGLPLQNGYGMTESTAGIAATRNPIGSPDISVGAPLPGVDVTLDAPGADGVGEVLTRGPHIMRGYFEASRDTAMALRADGFLRTGDLGRMDAEGRLTIVGRAKELIIRSGFNVYPQEVEAALNEHPSVAFAAVIGRPVDGNEEVLGFVQTEDTTLTEAALMDFVAKRLTAYKRPARIIVTERLPAAATGKILKHQLLGVFADLLG